MKANASKSQQWTGRILSGIAVLFMLFDGAIKFVKSPEAVHATVNLGYSEHHLLWMGTLAIFCTILYIIPRTAILGAVLLTGYYGGAIATHFRIDNPLFSHILFPVYLALFLWGGLWLREERLRQLLPFKG